MEEGVHAKAGRIGGEEGWFGGGLLGECLALSGLGCFLGVPGALPRSITLRLFEVGLYREGLWGDACTESG